MPSNTNCDLSGISFNSDLFVVFILQLASELDLEEHFTEELHNLSIVNTHVHFAVAKQCKCCDLTLFQSQWLEGLKAGVKFVWFKEAFAIFVKVSEDFEQL